MRGIGLALAIGATAALMAALGVGYEAAAQGRSAQGADSVQKTSGEAVGATASHPKSWLIGREPYTLEETYGYTLWRPESGDGHDHGGQPAVRVALAYGMDPSDIEGEVDRTVSEYADVGARREEGVEVGRYHEGQAVGPIPGSTPATRVFVPVNGRVYRIEVYAEAPGEEGLDADDRALLADVRFEPPSRSVASLNVPEANSVGALTAPVDEDLAELERAAVADKMAAGPDEGSVARSQSAEPRAGEAEIAEGCWQAPPDYFVQIQHGRKANSRPGDGTPTGFARVGQPNYWDEYTHGRLGYGRCDEPKWTNDKFAVDYRYNKGDYIYSPFKCGRVTFAGRNTTHQDYGRFVIVKSCNGGYASMSAHLSAVERKILRNPSVDRGSVIGYAGKSGGPDIPVGPVHLHQAFYRHPTYHQDGSPYGGQGLRVDRLRYFRGEGGTHVFGWTSSPGIKAKGSLAAN